MAPSRPLTEPSVPVARARPQASVPPPGGIGGKASIAVAWSVGATWILLKAIGAVIGLRPDESDERTGLDLSLHNESGYNL